MPDFNNGPGNDLNSSRSLASRRLFETNVNNDPPQANPNPVSDGEISVQVSYLWFSGGCHICPRAACLMSIMAQEVTRIVAPFWPPAFIRVQLEQWPYFGPRHLFESDLNNGPSLGHS